jgi:hypothetical protein
MSRLKGSMISLLREWPFTKLGLDVIYERNA